MRYAKAQAPSVMRRLHMHMGAGALGQATGAALSSSSSPQEQQPLQPPPPPPPRPSASASALTSLDAFLVLQQSQVGNGKGGARRGGTACARSACLYWQAGRDDVIRPG